MLIHSLGAVSAGYTAIKTVDERQTPIPVDEGSATDKVTLSSTGRTLAAVQESMTSVRTPAQKALLWTISDETAANADNLAHEMAYAPSRVMFDISNGDLRLASTGQVLGDDYVANLEKLFASIDAQQRALYDAEKANGTDPKEIVAKIIDFRNAQSNEYRVATSWGYL